MTFPQANSSTDQHFNPTVGTVKVPDSHSRGWKHRPRRNACCWLTGVSPCLVQSCRSFPAAGGWPGEECAGWDGTGSTGGGWDWHLPVMHTTVTSLHLGPEHKWSSPYHPAQQAGKQCCSCTIPQSTDRSRVLWCAVIQYIQAAHSKTAQHGTFWHHSILWGILASLNIVWDHGTLWTHSILCGIMAHFGLTQCCVRSWHTLDLLNVVWDHSVFWHHSILCGIMAHFGIIQYCVGSWHTLDSLNTVWDHGTLWIYSMLCGITAYFGITQYCVRSWHILASFNIVWDHGTLWTPSVLCGIMAHFGFTQCCVRSKHTLDSLNIMWDYRVYFGITQYYVGSWHSILCVITAHFGITQYCAGHGTTWQC